MLIGVPKEIKNHEYRVGLVPETVRELRAAGHDIIVEHSAGLGVGVDDCAFHLFHPRTFLLVLRRRFEFGYRELGSHRTAPTTTQSRWF